MYSTTTIVKNSKLSGKIVGTHQRIDQAARRALSRYIPRGKYFPTSKEIIYFEGTRGPDGLKRKSPGVDEPSHMLVEGAGGGASEGTDAGLGAVDDAKVIADEIKARPSEVEGHESLDQRSLMTLIRDHHWNLVRALKVGDHVRASFEAAWMAHMITDGLTPAHHFPLSSVKDELMTDKELVKVFGSPLKGIMHGRNMLETLRNNWLYWGAGGHMSKHIAYEYGVLMIVAAMPAKRMVPKLTKEDFCGGRKAENVAGCEVGGIEDAAGRKAEIVAGRKAGSEKSCGVDVEKMFQEALERVQKRKMFDWFREEGWTTELALETRDVLIPEIVRAVALGWYSAIEEAYGKKSR